MRVCKYPEYSKNMEVEPCKPLLLFLVLLLMVLLKLSLYYSAKFIPNLYMYLRFVRRHLKKVPKTAHVF